MYHLENQWDESNGTINDQMEARRERDLEQVGSEYQAVFVGGGRYLFLHHLSIFGMARLIDTQNRQNRASSVKAW